MDKLKIIKEYCKKSEDKPFQFDIAKITIGVIDDLVQYRQACEYFLILFFLIL